MKLLTLARYGAGYLIGFSVFFLAIPYGLSVVTKIFHGAAWNHIPLDPSVLLSLSVLFGIGGLFFVLWSNLALLLKGKGGATDVFNVAISPRTKHLVVTGPYRYTRNPMVFGAFSSYGALALYWNSLPTLALVAAFFVTMRYYLKVTEEKRLLKDFGQEYEEYRKRVPMIIPWPFKQ
jgi:protein-S-isoprenylcysteine O-methyltransferase Ste14